MDQKNINYVIPKVYKLGKNEREISLKHIYIEYIRFHLNPTNRLLHVFIIPLLLFSFVGIFDTYHIGLHFSFKGRIVPKMSLFSHKPIIALIEYLWD